MSNKIVIKGKPVSVNDLYTGRRFLTKEGKGIKQSMAWDIKRQWKEEMIKGYVGIQIDLFYSDKRRRDIDNPMKAIIDSMTSIVFEDDSQITELIVTKNVGENRSEITVYERDI